jgi:hypothetical protein
MNLQLLSTKPKEAVKPSIENEIVWGGRLFVNAQILLHLLSKLSKYKNGQETLENIFAYTNFVNQQENVKLFKELQQEIDEICFLEKEMKLGRIKAEDKNIINFIFDSVIMVLTSNITRKD